MWRENLKWNRDVVGPFAESMLFPSPSSLLWPSHKTRATSRWVARRKKTSAIRRDPSWGGDLEKCWAGSARPHLAAVCIDDVPRGRVAPSPRDISPPLSFSSLLVRSTCKEFLVRLKCGLETRKLWSFFAAVTSQEIGWIIMSNWVVKLTS